MPDIKERIEVLEGLDVWHLKTFGKLKSLMLSDGPHGIRKQTELGDNLGISASEISVAYPTGANLAASFNKKLVYEMAQTLALDAKSLGVGVVLGPAINIKRNPLCGRNFEYFSEDPYLTGMLAKNYIRGMEDNGIGTSVKHFFANNQESYRFVIDSVVDDRALNEIYLKAFKMAVTEKPASVMASYNKINGIHGTRHPVIKNLLKDKWGYDNAVISDWGAVTNRLEELKAGLDLQMPSSNNYHTKQLIEAFNKDGSLYDDIDESSYRVLSLINKYGSQEKIAIDMEEHHKKAVSFAEEGLVLLKNKNDMLPLNKDDKIALIGGFIEEMRYQGGGSSYINPYKVLEVKDEYEKYFKNAKIAKGYHINDFDNNDELIKEALTTAKASTKVVYFMGLPERIETEGIDRSDLLLPNNQIHLLNELLKVNKNIIVVLLTGSVVNLDFKDNVPAILLSYLAGEGSTEAILNTLTGYNNPSGRLPETWIKSIKDLPFEIKDNNNAVYYSESIFVGYRYFNTFKKAVNYPFGYGLSYAKVSYSDPTIERLRKNVFIKFYLTNNSDIKTKEVVQVYLSREKSHTYQPNKTLVAFDKISLDAYETKEVEIRVAYKEFEFYCNSFKEFVTADNNYTLTLAKDVETDIFAFDFHVEGKIYARKTKDSHQMFNDLAFSDIYEKPLPPENIEYKKPFSINSPLEALNKSFFGRFIVKYIMSEAVKELKGADSWVSDNVKTSLRETPLRCIASFAGDALNYEMAEGLVLIANNRLIKGYRKFKKGMRELDESRQG